MKRAFLAALVLTTSFVLWKCGTSPEGGGESRKPATPARLPVSDITGLVIFESPAGQIYVPDFPVTLKGGSGEHAATTNLMGQYRFANAAPGKYAVCWQAAGWAAGCTPQFDVAAGESGYPEAAVVQPVQPSSVAFGTVRLTDGSAATLVDRSSDAQDVPTIEVFDAGGKVIGHGR